MSTTKTKLAGVIGNPIGHSLSPALHTFLAEQTETDMAYLAFQPERSQLGQLFEGARMMNALGFNVTSPFKVDVPQFMDELDAEAHKMGNINTVVNRNGKWVGYNTDGEGFIRALVRRGFTAKGKKVLLLGTGGTARTLSYKLAQNGAESITISSRKENAAQLLKPVVAEFKDTKLLSGADAETSYDLVVNCTPIGMAPHIGETPMPAHVLYHKGMLCCDLIYNPAKTRFLQEAEQNGASILNGMNMFLYQGILAFELFTGHPLPLKICDKVFEKWSHQHD